MVWEVHASDEFGDEHIAQFHKKENAERHFDECLKEYGCATPPYEVEDDGEFCEDKKEAGGCK